MNEIHGQGWWLGLPAYFVLGPERLVGNVILIGILAIAFQRQPMPVQFILRASRPTLTQLAMLAVVGMLIDMSAPRQFIYGVVTVFIIVTFCIIYYGFDRSINRIAQSAIVCTQLYLTAVASLLAVISVIGDWL